MSRAFPSHFVLPSHIAAAENWRAVFWSENMVGQCSKSTTMTCVNQFCHTRFLKEWNADGVRITRGNTSSYSNRRFCVEKRLTKPRVCGIIFPASERGSPRSNRTFRGIAQLVEPRSPNVNRGLISRIITGFLRLETSVSSLFSCFGFCKSVKWFMQNRGENRQKILGQHQKTSNISLGQKGRFSHAWKIPTDIWMILSGLSFSTPP